MLVLAGLLAAGCAELNPEFLEPVMVGAEAASGTSTNGTDSSDGAPETGGTSSAVANDAVADLGGGCKGSTVPCGETCVDPQWNALHCGGCDQPCAMSQVCVEGMCALDCPSERPETCGITCVDLDTNAMHCGLCDRACTGDETCVAGVCTPPCATANQTSCDGECVDLQKDKHNCGACGVACSDRCDHGSCKG